MGTRGVKWAPSIHLTEHEGRLVAGGKFTQIGGVKASNVAACDGRSWQPLGEGLSNQRDVAVVYALAENQGELVAAGDFDGYSVVTWNGSSWQPLGSFIGTVLSLASIEGQLFAGGWVWDKPPRTLSGVVRWDEGEWQSLGSGTNGPVRAILQGGPSVFMGGQFTMSGGRSSFGMARWDGPDAPTASSLLLRTGAPNPFVTATDFAFRLVSAGRVRVSVLDIRGYEIAILDDREYPAGSHQVTWDGRNDHGEELPAGIYFVRLRLPGGEIQTLRTIRLR